MTNCSNTHNLIHTEHLKSIKSVNRCHHLGCDIVLGVWDSCLISAEWLCSGETPWTPCSPLLPSVSTSAHTRPRSHVRLHVHTHKPQARRFLQSLWEDFLEISYTSEHTWESERMFYCLNAGVCNCVYYAQVCYSAQHARQTERPAHNVCICDW